MRSATFLAFSLFAATALAQTNHEQLSARLTEAVSAEASLHKGWSVTCAVAQFSQGGAGTGSALVMYSPAPIVIDALVELRGTANAAPAHTWTIRGTSRRNVAEALEQIAEAAADRIEAALTNAPAQTVRELAQRD